MNKFKIIEKNKTSFIYFIYEKKGYKFINYFKKRSNYYNNEINILPNNKNYIKKLFKKQIISIININ